jgi:hypothetical protein
MAQCVRESFAIVFALVTTFSQVLAQGHHVIPVSAASAHGRCTSKRITHSKFGVVALKFLRAAGLVLTAPGMMLIGRLVRLTFLLALVRGGTRAKLAAWNDRQVELMSWFKVNVVS